MADTRNVVVYLLEERELARKYSKVPLDRPRDKTDEIWIPRSQIEHTSKRGAEHTIKIPEWIADEKGL